MGHDEQQGAWSDAQSAVDARPASLSIDRSEQEVEIHRPKPVHGWRGLLNEIGVIVIGVLIALAAEQAVEAVHWHHQIEAGTDALRDNARDLVDSAAQREALSPCVGQRLAAIASALDEASETGRLPAIGQLGGPARRLFAFASWDALVASQVATHMPREQMLSYAAIAAGARDIARLNADEFAAWTDLYTIVGPGRRFGDAEQASARLALSRAVLAAKHLRSSAEQLTGTIARSGLLRRQEITAVRTKAGKEYAIDARNGIMCKPLSDAPKANHYGQGPSPVDLSTPFKP